MDSECRSILSRIKSLEIQGATRVAEAGLRCLEITARKSRAKTRDAFIKELEKAGRDVVKVRVTEPALRNAVASVILKAKVHEELKTIKKAVASECREHINGMREIVSRIAEIGAGEIRDGEVVLTHCHSMHVVEILKRAKSQGKRIEVIVTETRPRNQGVVTAKELIGAGLKVTYCVDSAFGYVMRRVNRMLVGCDAILADGSVVNKIGTFPMAVMAEKFGIPVIVAGGTYKFDPQTLDGRKEPIEMRSPGEVIKPAKLPKANIINPAFDITPAEFVTSIITERGVTKPQWIREMMEVEHGL